MGAKENIIKVLISTKEPLNVKAIAEKIGLGVQSVRNYLREIDEEGTHIDKKRVGKFITYNLSQSLEDRILASDYDYLRTSSQKPIVLPVDEHYFQIAGLNTLYAGAKTDKLLVRNFLRHCDRKEVDALLITGNTFYIDSMKFSKNAVDRARITDQPKRNVKRGEYDVGLFMDLEERLELSKSLLSGLFTGTDGKPLYKGPVYAIFGEVEENLVRQHTSQLVKYLTFQRRAELSEQISELRQERKKYNKTYKPKCKKRHEKDGEMDDKTPDTSNYPGLKAAINEQIMAIKRELAKTVMSNLDKNEVKRIEEKVLGYLVNYLESAIPNSTVIPAGEGHISADGKRIKMKYSSFKNSNAASDNMLSSLLASERRRLSSGKIIDDVIIQGGMSTTYTQNMLPYMTGEGEKEAMLIQLPTCLDRSDLEKKLKYAVLAKDPLTNLASKPDFITGGVIIEFIDGIAKSSLSQGGFLTNPKIDFDNYEPEMFYELNYGDEHYGSKEMSVIETKNDVIPATRVAYEFLEQNGIPIVKINHLGDALQEKNFDTEAEEHPLHKNPAQLEKSLKGIKDPKQVIKAAKLNEYRAGILMPEKQLDAYIDDLSLDFIKQVIENAEKANLVGPVYTIVPGNHTKHTFEGLFNPERQIAKYIQRMLGIKDDNIVHAPMIGKIGFYEGEFGIKDKYLYAETSLHKHGSSKYKDPMRTVRRTYSQMGRPSGLAEGKFVINRSGHTHFGGETSSTGVHHIQGFCFQESNAYGVELQYPSPTAKGFKINGYPVKGPHYGPVTSINIPLSYLKKWAQKKQHIDTGKIFSDSIV